MKPFTLLRQTRVKTSARMHRLMCSTPPVAFRQRGVVLFVALIALVAMTLAAIALVRSVDTANVISGNLAFRQGGIQASDVGVEAAVTALPTIISTTLETSVTGSTGTYWYYASRRKENSLGLPTVTEYTPTVTAGAAINWSSVPTASTTANGYTVKVVIDRLCQGPPPVTDIQLNCLADLPVGGGGSRKAGATVFSASQQVYYRATVQVSGPRNTLSYIQTILAR